MIIVFKQNLTIPDVFLRYILFLSTFTGMKQAITKENVILEETAILAAQFSLHLPSLKSQLLWMRSMLSITLNPQKEDQ